MAFSKYSTASITLSAVTVLNSTISNPWLCSHSICFSLLFSKSMFPASTKLNAKKLTFLLAVISLFSCLTEPLQRFLGFLYFASASGMDALILSNWLYVMTASPRRTSRPSKGISTGTLAKTLALLVMTSPTSPLPLVNALTRVPPS